VPLNKYHADDQIEKEMGVSFSKCGERKGTYMFLIGRPGGKRPRIQESLDFLILEIGPIGCTETSVRNYHYMLRYIQKRADLIYLTMEALNHVSVGLLWTR
jgi:hypothetical protein